MLRILSRYALLSLFSFTFFTAAFHAVAHAQTTPQPIQQQPSPMPKIVSQEQISIQTDTPPQQQTDPTPTIFVLVTITPTTTPGPEAKKDSPTPNNTSSTPTPLASKTDIAKVTANISPTPTTLPTPTQAQAIAGSLDADKLFSMTNAHRQSKGLAPLQKDEKTCSLAVSRAPEIAAEMAAGTLHSGMYARNLPYWNTENAIALGSEEAAFNWWLNDPIHRQAIEGNHTHSCAACSGKYCVQEFTSYQAK